MAALALKSANVPSSTPRPAPARGKFFIVEHQFLLQYLCRLGSRAPALNLALCKYADFRTGVCFPKITTLAGVLGVSERTVQRQLKALEREGLLRVESGKQTGHPNTYVLLRPWEERQECPTGSDSVVVPGTSPMSQGVRHFCRTEPEPKNENYRTKTIDHHQGEGGEGLFLNCSTRIEAQPDMNDEDPGAWRMTSTKYAGQRLDTVDRDWLEWAAGRKANDPRGLHKLPADRAAIERYLELLDGITAVEGEPPGEPHVESEEIDYNIADYPNPFEEEDTAPSPLAHERLEDHPEWIVNRALREELIKDKEEKAARAAAGDTNVKDTPSPFHHVTPSAPKPHLDPPPKAGIDGTDPNAFQEAFRALDAYRKRYYNSASEATRTQIGQLTVLALGYRTRAPAELRELYEIYYEACLTAGQEGRVEEGDG
ncbi:MAG: helix-turn-helix domain-containing protein [Armatimonadota bacterium]